MGTCKKCSKNFPRGEMIEGVCVDCIFELGKKIPTISKEDVERARRAVEAETAGLINPLLLEGILEDFADQLEEGTDRHIALIHASSEIQRLGGLGMCRELMKISDALEKNAHDMQDEVRHKIRVLSNMKKE